MSKYSKHKERWLTCTDCALHKKRHKVVLCRGTKIQADILYIGEAPGVSEDRIGRPFVGQAGRLLDDIIETVDRPNYSYVLTNLIACIPLDKTTGKTKEPSSKSIAACQPRVAQFAVICKPELVVFVGKLAEKHGIPLVKDMPISKLTNKPPATVAIIHPAAILRMDITQQGLAFQRCVIALCDAIDDLVPF